MGLPPKVFYTLTEAAARWSCTVADIAGWASMGQLRIVTGIAPMHAGGETIGGLVEISAADMLSMFRRCGSGPLEGQARRVRPITDTDDRPWVYITEPVDGLRIEMPDLMILASDAQRFEEEHEIFGPLRTIVIGPGARQRYDWEAFWQHLAVRLYRDGVPDTQEELIAEMREFFARRSETGDVPDDRTLRRRIKPIWHELKAQA